MINAFHSFFLFLGRNPGILFKHFIYLIIFTLVNYMIISEYSRSRKHEYKYLIVAFSALSLQALANVSLYFLVVFQKLNIVLLEPILPLTEHALELFAIVLLTNAFLYKLVRNKQIMRDNLTRDLLVALIFTATIEILWLISLTNNFDQRFNQYPGYPIFMILKLVVLLAPVFGFFYTKATVKYKFTIFTAFLFYSISPAINLLNYMFYNSASVRLTVFAQPWPFISAIWFTRVIYLKLADKAFLKSKLRESNKLYEHEKSLNKLKDEFVSIVSHELRTPLTSIKLYISLLKAKKLKPNQATEAYRIINEEADRLANLINDILDLNKLESNKISLCMARFNLGELKNKMYYTLAEKKKLKVIFKFPKNAKVTCDPDKVKQVFINLMSNAAKFTEKGSIVVSIKVESKEWSLSVRDTGKGISQENIARLFDKFFQVGDYMTRTVKGTGLGLAIVKKIVDMHNGSIDVKSKVGKGTEFILKFPNFK